MKLYTNGCSFTQGTYPFTSGTNDEKICQTYNGYEYWAEKQSFVWPWKLAEHFDFVFNHGKMSTGFDRVVRTTLEFIECLDPNEYDEWIFIIEPTIPDRKEYIYDDGKIGQVSLPIPGTDQKAVVFFHTRDHDLNFMDELSFEDKPTKALIEYHLWFQNMNSFVYDQYKNLLLLHGVFKAKGIKYLYCPLMFDHATVSNRQHNIDCTNNLVSNLDGDNIIKCMIQILKDADNEWEHNLLIQNDNHPNALGNQLIADHIKTELEKRNWLT